VSTGAVAAPARASSPRRRHLTEHARGERRLAAILVAPALVVMLAVTAYPIIDAFVLSLQRADLRFPTQNRFIGLTNYGHVLSAPVWWQDVLHTAIITVISVSIQFVLGMCLALIMHRVMFARGLVRGIALVPYAIVAVVAAYSWQLAFSLNSGWIPKLLGLTGDPLSHTFGLYVAIIVAEVWKNAPFMALLLLAGLALVPDELHEAARVDGATTWQRLVRITLPLMKPAILVALLFRTLDAFRIFDTIYIFGQGAQGTESISMLNYSTLLDRLNLGLGSAVSVLLFWNDFVFAISLTSTSAAQTVPAAISSFSGISQFTVPYGDIAAAAMVVTVPVLILVLLFQRRIVSGLTAGAVKG
jgi:multiple sugar transport system permease protein